MAFNLADLFEHTVDAVPDRLALVVGDRRRTYGELERNANRFANWLTSRGIEKGHHVGIHGFNSIEWVEAFLACFKIRAVPININYRYVEDELRYMFGNADIVALVHDRQFCPRIAGVKDEFPALHHFVSIEDGSTEDCGQVGSVPFEEVLASGSPERQFGPRSEDDLYILYTGGTTGYPKGVMWRHDDVYRTLGGGIDFVTGEYQTDEYSRAKAAADTDPGASITTAPLMHGAAQWGTLGGFFGGNTVVLLPKFEPHEVWRAIQQEKVNTLSITGDAMARPLVEALVETTYDTSSLFAIASTAAVFSPSVKEQFLQLLPNVIITEAVGSSETGYNGRTILEKGMEHRPGGPTVDMGPDTIVLDDNMKPVEPGSGVIGRMARGGNVPLGYYKDPDKTAATFVTVEGRRYAIPGDFAMVEADGKMTLLGRGSESINSGGEKIYPEEVESVLKSHPSVFDAIVVGVPDERWGQKVTAVVQTRGGRKPNLEELAEHARTKIAGYKVPRELVVVDEIQRHPSGKPDYPWARAQALETLGLKTS